VGVVVLSAYLGLSGETIHEITRNLTKHHVLFGLFRGSCQSMNRCFSR
jgi:hypothetical protein